MTTPKEALELKPCPFCGATPHRGLGKVYRDQLHGDPQQDFSIWCPKGHAKVTGVNAALTADEWNTRTAASLQGEDAVERVARIKSLLASFHRNSCYPEAKAGELFGPRLSDEYDQCIYSPAAGDEYSLCGDHLRAARQLMEEVK